MDVGPRAKEGAGRMSVVVQVAFVEVEVERLGGG